MITTESLQYSDLVSAEERETTITVSHFDEVFHVFTTNKRMGNHLLLKFPQYAKLSEDKASVAANSIPVSEITKIHLSKLK